LVFTLLCIAERDEELQKSVILLLGFLVCVGFVPGFATRLSPCFFLVTVVKSSPAGFIGVPISAVWPATVSAEKATTLLADMAYCSETFAWRKLLGLLIFIGAGWLPVLLSLYIITTTFEGTYLSVDAFCILGRELRMPRWSPLRSSGCLEGVL